MDKKNNAARFNHTKAHSILIPQDAGYCEALEGETMPNRPWTAGELAILRRYTGKATAAKIGRAIGRSAAGIYYKQHTLADE